MSGWCKYFVTWDIYSETGGSDVVVENENDKMGVVHVWVTISCDSIKIKEHFSIKLGFSDPRGGQAWWADDKLISQKFKKCQHSGNGDYEVGITMRNAFKLVKTCLVSVKKFVKCR